LGFLLPRALKIIIIIITDLSADTEALDAAQED